MKHLLSTGQVAGLLRCTEPELAEVVRRGRVVPAPAVLAGRRLWEPEHIFQAAEALGLLDDDLRAKIGEEVSHGAR